MRSQRSVPLLFILILPFAFALAFRLAPLPYAIERYLGQAQVETANQNAAQAAHSLRQVLAIEPWRGSLWEQVGDLALQAADLPQAIEAFEQASSNGALSREGQYRLGQAYAENGDAQAALRTWQALLARDPAQTEVYEAMAGLQRQQGAFEDAIATLRQWLSVEPQNQAAHYQLALLVAAVYPQQGPALLETLSSANSTLAQKLKTLTQILRDPPDDAAYQQLMLGRALGDLGQWDLAEHAFNEAARLRPDYAEAWALLGEARQQMGQDGLPELERANALQPDSVVVQSLLALYWRRQGKLDVALDYLEKAADQEPQEPVWQMELGNTLAEMKDNRTALEHYQQAVELAPHDSEGWFVLARFCVANYLELRSVGLPAARQALLLEPDNASYLDLAGWALIELEDPLSAERFLQHALRVDNSLADAHLHLGQVYLQMGETQLAYQHLSQALQLSSTQEEVHRLAERLIARYFP